MKRRPSVAVQKSLFLNLPWEIRQDIYRHSIVETRRPPAKSVHYDWLRNTWKDRPSPLLAVNRQIRAEVVEFLKQHPVTIRVSWQDIKMDCLGLSVFIANKCKWDGDIRHMIVEIWPPVGHRPIDTALLLRNIKKLEVQIYCWFDKRLLATLDVVFLENEFANWSSPEGTPWSWLSHIWWTRGYWTRENNDMYCMLMALPRRRRTAEAHIHLPDSLLTDGKNPELRELARKVENAMMENFGIGSTLHDPRWVVDHLWLSASEHWCFHVHTSHLAKPPPDALIENVEFTISRQECYNLVLKGVNIGSLWRPDDEWRFQKTLFQEELPFFPTDEDIDNVL